MAWKTNKQQQQQQKTIRSANVVVSVITAAMDESRG